MLGFVPVNEKVRVFSAGETDNFGITVKDTVGTEYECNFRFNTDYKKIPVADGSEIVFTATMLFPHPLKLKVGDLVEFTDDFENKQKKTVKLVQFKRDFAGQVMTVKAVI